MSKRQKRAVKPVPSKKEAQEALKAYAEANSKLKEIEGELEQKLQAVRDEYAQEIEKLNTEKDECFDLVEHFSNENKEELFRSKRSLDWVHCHFGYRTGNKKVSAVKGFTQKASLELAQDFGMEEFLRINPQLNKQAIISAWDDEEQRKKVEKIKLEVTQEETFFIDPKEEELSEV